MQRQMSGSSVGGNQISPFMVSNRRNIPVHTIPVKRTFKGDGTCIWSEFLRYLRIFENKMAGMMIKNAKCFSQCYGTGRNLLIPSGTMRHQEQNP